MFVRPRALQDRLRGAVLPGLGGHLSGSAVELRIARAFASLGIPSRCGFQGRVTTLRLRRSMATSMRDAGATLAQIKAALGDESDQVALLYIEPTPQLVAEIDRAMDAELEKFVARFGPRSFRRGAGKGRVP